MAIDRVQQENFSNVDEQGGGSEEFFQIIDETGEGWGFDLDPQTVANPLAGICATLFGFGMLAGIPAGLWAGRAQLSTDKKPIRPSVGGFMFAARAFIAGTALCGAFGVSGFYAIKWYYDADSFEEFGRMMRETAPLRKAELEKGFGPAISYVRRLAAEKLPEPLARARTKFQESKAGIWVRSHFKDPSSSTSHEIEETES